MVISSNTFTKIWKIVNYKNKNKGYKWNKNISINTHQQIMTYTHLLKQPKIRQTVQMPFMAQHQNYHPWIWVTQSNPIQKDWTQKIKIPIYLNWEKIYQKITIQLRIFVQS